ncbi:hypothetical protein AU476_14415 [Cupriavidus sp. UYMSc13B]|nr:hypothetical protein AU476_14415 [Cupriavidus sp. UYMSc13B]
MQAMRERYLDIRLHLVESLPGNLATMVDTRQLHLASGHHCCSLAPLFTERLFVIARRDMPGLPTEETVKLARFA